MVEKIKDLILSIIDDSSGDIALTALFNYSELSNLISGDKHYELPNKNGSRSYIVLIEDVNDNFIIALNDLRRENLVTLDFVSDLVVIADGGRVINLPICTEPIDSHEFHWLPVVIKRVYFSYAINESPSVLKY